MTQQQKEKVVITWRVLALALLTAGQTIIWNEVRQVKLEIQESRDFRISSTVTNRTFIEAIAELKSRDRELEGKVDKLGLSQADNSARIHTIESWVYKYK